MLEFNARMGDPETQVVLPLLKTDFLDVLEAVVEHRLDQVQVEWHDGHAVCVVMTSAGYPGPYDVGEPIRGLDSLDPQSATVFHAGTASTRGGHRHRGRARVGHHRTRQPRWRTRRRRRIARPSRSRSRDVTTATTLRIEHSLRAV